MDQSHDAHTHPGPLPIRRLHESVINRIAAGEIVQRPSSALKELLENSLDAGSTSIRITVKDGGMKLLQIQDNGCGIRKTDLPILAERFTTSKISTFSDLSKLTTYGFRGEALASISYVAQLTVITKTKADTCAWKACYSDGVLVPVKEGLTPDPKACAGNNGTTISVENLFYNTPMRLSALRTSSEEYSRVLDVVTKYAIHNPHVSFQCKKSGSVAPEISTPSGSTVRQTIRQVYGSSIEKDLLHTSVTSTNNDDASTGASDTAMDVEETWSAEAYFTNANYQAKKFVFLLFINHRLVDSPRMKKALEAIYTGILPKGTCPFMYLSLQINPESLDVNVHPTKSEVHFLDEEAITERITTKLLETLVGQSQSRVFEYQTLLTGGILQTQSKSLGKGKGKERAVEHGDVEGGSGSNSSSSVSTPAVKKAPQHKIRTSQKDRTLDSMFPVVNPSQLPDKLKSKSKDTEQGDPEQDAGSTSRPSATARASYEIKESECYLTSVGQLRSEVLGRKHTHLTEILENHIFVGIVDLSLCLSLVQHSTSLYLVNHGALSEELFYQLGLRQFGNFKRIKLEPPPPLRTLVKIAVEAEETTEGTSLTKPQIIEKIVNILTSRTEMLDEYFSLKITPSGLVESIPLLLKDYTPNLDKLPLFFMRLGPQVDWTAEKSCFETFLRELAFFYVPEPLLPDRPSTPISNQGTDSGKGKGKSKEQDNATEHSSPITTGKSKEKEVSAEEQAMRWQIQHALFPAMKRYLVAPKTLLARDVVQVASLPDLYRVFERC